MKIGGQANAGEQAGRILLYDDDHVLLDALRLALVLEGYDVKSTHSEREAITLACGECFDLAIADLGLRRSKGYQVVKAIRENRPETPVLAMTACQGAETLRFAREYAKALLDKPFSLSEMISAVHCVLHGEEWAGAHEFSPFGETSPLTAEGSTPCLCHAVVDERRSDREQGVQDGSESE